MPKTTVVIVDDANHNEEWHNAVATAVSKDASFRVAVDLEGVNLGRVGTIELVSVAFADDDGRVFLLDVQEDPSGTSDRAAGFKELVQNPHCELVIHDCRQDSDALFHHWNLELERVHDTSEYHNVLRRVHNANLNDTLREYDLPANPHRERINYGANHAFWGQRPLTEQMIAHATGDVASLLDLAVSQHEAASRDSWSLGKCKAASANYVSCLKDMQCEDMPCRIDMGRFIGRRGANMRGTERSTGCFFYGRGNAVERNRGFLVYYPSQTAKQAAMRALGCA